jgi:ParB/RepB/Spo0J family partition protein
MNDRESTSAGACVVPPTSSLAMLPVAQLRPNDCNPNRMAEAEFAELVAEIKHLGRLPKPVVVRRQGDTYLIVDGEHNWRAAQQPGLTEVPCELVEADDFEAMRQTYKRNQHGTHDPVALGRMFRRMMEGRGLSGRAFAEEIGVSEGTVRNALLYAEAADLRNGYAAARGPEPVQLFAGRPLRFAPRSPEAEVGELSVREVRVYVDLPAVVRDAWMNGGHSLQTLDKALRLRKRIRPDGPKEEEGTCDQSIFDALAEVGLTGGIAKYAFVNACHRAIRMWFWWDFYRRHFASAEDLRAYIAVAAELGLDVRVLDDMPVRATDEGIVFLLSVEEWRDLLTDCISRDEGEGNWSHILGAALRVALRKKGHAVEDVTDPRIVDALDRLQAAPDFIREAECLTVLERLWLHEAALPDLTEDEAAEVKRDVVRVVALRRRVLDDPQIGPAYRSIAGTAAVDAVTQERFDECRRRRQEAADAALSDDPERMLNEFVHGLKDRDLHLREGMIGDRPVADVLKARLRALPVPERDLFLRLMTLGASWGIGAWMKAVAAELGQSLRVPQVMGGPLLDVGDEEDA